MLEKLQPAGPRNVLELGCGTGDATFGLLRFADRIDAVEPSSEMLSVAWRRAGAEDPRIRWIRAPSEQAEFYGPYSLALAAESLHWMEWSTVLPKVAAALAPGAFLVLAERGASERMPWDTELGELIGKYSTNREFRPYDLVSEITGRSLFREAGRRTTAPMPFAQSIDDHIESMHSRNGFSRDRMPAESAMEFDALYRQLLDRYCPEDVVRLQTVATVIWGYPQVRGLRE
jgi:SAM-dependent methyltransferase